MTDDANFLRQFEAGAFLPEQWHHREHIKAAYLYLRQYPFEAALERMRTSIKALNAAHKLPEAPTRGYHETMTRAWMRLVSVTLDEYGPAETADSFYEQNPQLSQPKVLRLFYSRELMLSLRAKTQFVEPDLAPLPERSRQSEGGKRKSSKVMR